MTAQELFDLLQEAKGKKRARARAPVVHKLMGELNLKPENFDRPHHVILTAERLIHLRLCEEKGIRKGVLVATVMNPDIPSSRVSIVQKDGRVRLADGRVREPQHLTVVPE